MDKQACVCSVYKLLHALSELNKNRNTTMSKIIEMIHLKVFLYLNDIERECILKGAEGIDNGMLKLFLLLYAEDIIYLQIQLSLYNLENYFKRWKLKVNTQKTKVMVCRKG